MGDLADRLTAALSGRYALERELGQGGMATVYLAHDVRHDRKVAIKVLRPELAAAVGARRFLAEIRTTANLQHPHILPLFDSGEVEGSVFYVMPYVAGESLRERLGREKQLPLDEAVRIASEVADALDYAHRQGVIHRDVKPANVLLHEGRAVVADFGIALAVTAAGGARLTETGLNLGTPAYMSPEQATGDRIVDGRADVYALGCMVHEMLAGDPPHVASTAQAMLAKILTDTPRPLRELRETVPPQVEAAVLRAVARLPADRWGTALEFAEALSRGAAPGAHEDRLRPAPSVGRLRPRETVAWVIATLALTGAAVSYFSRSSEPEGSLARWTLTLPDSIPLSFVGGSHLGPGLVRTFDVSADGRWIAFVSARSGTSRLHVRDNAFGTIALVPGSEGAYHPLFSPHGEWIAFFAEDRVMKAPLAGGSAVLLAELRALRSGAWISNERIAVAWDNSTKLALIPAGGGVPEHVPGLCLKAGSIWRTCQGMDPLPGGDALLVTGTRDIAIASLDTGVRWELKDGLLFPKARYVPSGHLLYSDVTSGQVFAVTFDAERLEMGVDPRPVLSDVRLESGGIAQLATSRDGLLVYARGGSGGSGNLAWVGADGVAEELPFAAERFGYFDLSPDGTRILAEVQGLASQIWLYEVESGDASPLTTGPAHSAPVWSPDGSEFLYKVELPEGRFRLERRALDGGAPTVVIDDFTGWPIEWLPSDTVLVEWADSLTLTDVVRVSLESGAIETLVSDPGVDFGGRMSPDGQWLAYTSDRNGMRQVFVEPYPQTEERWAVSGLGGAQPAWLSNDALMYRQGDDFLSVDVSGGPADAAPPELLFSGPYLQLGGMSFDVAPDGRVLVLQPTDGRRSTVRLEVVTGWFDELERAAPRASGR